MSQKAATATKPQTREELLALLRAHKARLMEAYGLEEMALFGSWAHDAQQPDSDVDILVRFRAQPRFEQLHGLYDELVMLVGRRVDLVQKRLLRPSFAPFVLREAVPL